MPVPRLVAFTNPEGRETPLLLLAELRQLYDCVELVYFGNRSWRLGGVRPNDMRREKGAAILRFEESRDAVRRNPRNLFLGQLLMQGFAQIEEYIGNDPAGPVEVLCTDEFGRETTYETTIVADLRERVHRLRSHNVEEEEHVAIRAAVSAGEPRREAAEAVMKHYTATEALAHYRREVRARVNFGVGGMTGGQGRLILPPGY